MCARSQRAQSRSACVVFLPGPRGLPPSCHRSAMGDDLGAIQWPTLIPRDERALAGGWGIARLSSASSAVTAVPPKRKTGSGVEQWDRVQGVGSASGHMRTRMMKHHQRKGRRLYERLHRPSISDLCQKNLARRWVGVDAGRPGDGPATRGFDL